MTQKLVTLQGSWAVPLLPVCVSPSHSGKDGAHLLDAKHMPGTDLVT